MEETGTERPLAARAGAAAAILAPLAGPALIAAAVLVVLHDFAFGGRFTLGHDLEAYFLPNFCYAGRTLSAGVVPGWNPFVLSGVPFAADPQSGWMYLPVMALFGTLQCGTAMLALTVLQPVIAGLALYWFLRTEQLSRSAATIGGLLLALGVAGSRLAITVPFAGSLAWSAVLLAVTARYLRAPTWPARLVWLVAVAAAWGTLAAAHLSQGLVMGTGAFLVYLVARTLSDVRAGRLGRGEGLLMGGLAVAVLVPVNLAFLLPRLGFLPSSSLGLGYDEMRLLGAAINEGNATGVSWPLRFSTSPGTYLGAIALVLSFGGWWLPGRRGLTAAFTLFAAVIWFVGLKAVVAAVGPVVRDWPLADVYVHGAARLQYGVLLAIPVLSALGVDAWRRGGAVARILMLVPGLVVWGWLPLLLDVDPERLALIHTAAPIAAVALLLVAFRPALAALLPVVVAVELVANGLVGQTFDRPLRSYGRDLGRGWAKPFHNMPEPDVEMAAFFRAGPIVEALRAGGVGRYQTLSQMDGPRPTVGNYLRPWRPRNAGLLDQQRAMLFGVEDVQGYNPAQLVRYWNLVREANQRPVRYNQGLFVEASGSVLDLLQVRWIIAPRDAAPRLRFPEVARQRRWVLYERPSPPRAELVSASRVVPEEDALEIVASGRFDSSREILLEQDPPVELSGRVRSPGSARYRWLGTQEAQVTVDAGAPAMLLIRTPYDPNWRATIDGRPAHVVPADYVLQAVAVPPGRNVVHLRYHDPSIGLGALLSLLSVTALLGAALVLRARGRRAAPPEAAERQPAEVAAAR